MCEDDAKLAIVLLLFERGLSMIIETHVNLLLCE